MNNFRACRSFFEGRRKIQTTKKKQAAEGGPKNSKPNSDLLLKRRGRGIFGLNSSGLNHEARSADFCCCCILIKLNSFPQTKIVQNNQKYCIFCQFRVFYTIWSYTKPALAQSVASQVVRQNIFSTACALTALLQRKATRSSKKGIANSTASI